MPDDGYTHSTWFRAKLQGVAANTVIASLKKQCGCYHEYVNSHSPITAGDFTPGTVLLETLQPLQGLPTDSYLFTNPITTLEQAPHETLHDFLTRAEAFRTTHWLAGYVSFEAGFDAHHVPHPVPHRAPLAWFGVYEAPERITPPYAFTVPGSPVAFWRLKPEQSDEAFAAAITDVLERIAKGELAEVNITGRLFSEQTGSLLARYRALTDAQPTAFNAALAFTTAAGEPVEIASLSPELFYTLDARGNIAMRPMKGTAKRGATPEADAALAEWLQNDPKNREENRVITEMLLAELAGVTKPGTLGIAEKYTLEAYKTVWQMTSTIAGEATTTELPALFAALFPCGSIAGPPKDRMLRLIHHLEFSPRGVYTGAIGFAAPDGSATFSVAIRTLTKVGDHLEYGIGSGIVAGSDAHDEVREWHLKGKFLTHADTAHVNLIETLRYEPGEGLVRVQRHLARLARSAAWLGCPAPTEAIFERLMALQSAVPLRVRVELAQDGTFVITTAPLGAGPRSDRVAIARSPVERANPFLQHKTTERALFHAATQYAQAHGFADVLFRNEDGEVTEGAISNVFLKREGVLLTPPVRAGLLPGVLREELLETGNAREQVLYVDDLRSGELFLGNSLRGLRPVVLTDTLVTIQ